MPPRKNASSIRIFQALSVRITRSYEGAFLVVTRAVRIGASSLENAPWITDNIFNNFANGPSGNGLLAFSCSCFVIASNPLSWYILSASSEKITAFLSNVIRICSILSFGDMGRPSWEYIIPAAIFALIAS